MSHSCIEPVDAQRRIYGSHCLASTRAKTIRSEHDRIAALSPPELNEIQTSRIYQLFQIQDLSCPDDRITLWHCTKALSRIFRPIPLMMILD